MASRAIGTNAIGGTACHAGETPKENQCPIPHHGESIANHIAKLPRFDRAGNILRAIPFPAFLASGA